MIEAIRTVHDMQIEFDIPIRVVSEANQREHWRTKAKRAKSQRMIGRLYGNSKVNALRKELILRDGAIITFTRVAFQLMDDDNLAGASKAVRDGVCDALGMKDGPKSGLTFRYAQEQGPPKIYAVRVCIEVTT